MAPKHSRRTLLRYGLGTAAAAMVPAIPASAAISTPTDEQFEMFLALSDRVTGTFTAIRVVVANGAAYMFPDADPERLPVLMRYGVMGLVKDVIASPDDWTR